MIHLGSYARVKQAIIKKFHTETYRLSAKVTK